MGFSAFGGGEYEAAEQDHDYEYDTGLIVLPVASRTAAHRVIRLHGGVGTRVVRWKTQRKNRPPVVPPMSDTANDTFIGGNMISALPLPNPENGTYFFQMSGEYTYVQNTPRIVGEDPFPTGAHPFPLPVNDALAQDTAASIFVANQTEALASDNPNAFIQEKIAEVIVKANNQYNWPFTFTTSVFSDSSLIGG